MKNKTKIFFIILLMVFGLLFCMSSDCFATNIPDFSEYVVDGDGYVLYYDSVEELYELNVFHNTSSTNTQDFDFSNPLSGYSVYYGNGVDFGNSGKKLYPKDGTRLMFYVSPGSGKYYQYKLIDNVWNLSYEKTSSSWAFSQGVPSDFLENIVSINFDLYSTGSDLLYDSGSVLVFQKPLEEPPVEEEPPVVVEKTLAPIMEKTPLEEVMQEILGILPVILVIIVGLISLRKALQILSRVLHRS